MAAASLPCTPPPVCVLPEPPLLWVLALAGTARGRMLCAQPVPLLSVSALPFGVFLSLVSGSVDTDCPVPIFPRLCRVPRSTVPTSTFLLCVLCRRP